MIEKRVYQVAGLGWTRRQGFDFVATDAKDAVRQFNAQGWQSYEPIVRVKASGEIVAKEFWK